MNPPLPDPRLPAPVPFLGDGIHPVTTAECIAHLTRWASEGADPTSDAPPRARCVTYLNAHCSNLADDDPEYRAALRDFDLVYADGQGVVWAARLLGRPVPGRVNAGDFILDFCRACAARGLRLFLLGGAEGLAEQAAAAWRAAAPGIEIVGTHHGFLIPGEEDGLARRIRAARPHCLIVGMSAPRQELWTRRAAPDLGVPVLWCVGALFEYYAHRRRAPVWMRRAGLEWLFRLALEPRRLWRRYLPGNLRFIARVLRRRLTAPRDPR